MRNKIMDGRGTSSEELMLIRIGHHLWRSRCRSEWPQAAMDQALEAVWDAKESIRVPLRRSWLETSKKRISRLAEWRQS